MTVGGSTRGRIGCDVPVGAVPRDYNFAADVLQSNLDAGRANKPAYIDARGTWTYGQLADRVARFAAALRGLGIGAKNACCWRCSTPSTGRPRFSAA